MAKKAADGPKKLTKTQLHANIAEATELSRKEVAAVFDALEAEIANAIGKNGPGEITLPGLVKIVRKATPARPAQKDVWNPFKQVKEDRPAKPAGVKPAVRALKKLKEMVQA